MPWKDPAKQAEYQRRYLADPEKKAKHKAAADKYRRENAEFRKNILAGFGCHLCDIIDPDLIDWHHVYPEEKLFDIKGGLSKSHNEWWNEVLKCIPVCCNCHRKIHTNKLCLLPKIQ